MQDEQPKAAGAPPAATSWLVRCWVEPREEGHEGDPPVVRCCVRDLRTGQERYLSDPRALGELLLRHLRAEASGALDGEAEGRNLLAGG
jgi:hypothetical protein